MQRIAMQRLKEWKVSTHRKPLIIRGVRQVGKTWLMTQFAREHFAGRFHYFNFDMDPALRELFRASRSPKVILEALAYRSERSIETGDLIIFDEAQAAPEAIHALKYFCEFRSDLFVLLAGSLLGLQLARPESYPVGKVDFLTLEPMTFTEFLLAQGTCIFHTVGVRELHELVHGTGLQGGEIEGSVCRGIGQNFFQHEIYPGQGCAKEGKRAIAKTLRGKEGPQSLSLKSVQEYGWVNNNFVSDIGSYNQYRYMDGKSPLTWWSGIKHDCSKVMELTLKDGKFINGFGQAVEIENNLIYPLIKSSDIKKDLITTTRKYIIITQKATSEDTDWIRESYPLTYKYLDEHAALLDNRKSSI